MPLRSGKSKETVSKNISTEMHSYDHKGSIGTSHPESRKKAQKQAVAIALSKTREKRASIPGKKINFLKTLKPQSLKLDKLKPQILKPRKLELEKIKLDTIKPVEKKANLYLEKIADSLMLGDDVAYIYDMDKDERTGLERNKDEYHTHVNEEIKNWLRKYKGDSDLHKDLKQIAKHYRSVATNNGPNADAISSVRKSEFPIIKKHQSFREKLYGAIGGGLGAAAGGVAGAALGRSTGAVAGGAAIGAGLGALSGYLTGGTSIPKGTEDKVRKKLNV